MNKIATFCIMVLLLTIAVSTISYASLTKEQSDDVAAFATTFIEKGNERRDENGYPLLVYALSNSGNTCIEIRRSGYNSELYYIKNNNYHKKNGNYLELGYKWCMDCGDFISFIYYRAFGLDMMIHPSEDPWHIKDMYADANKYDNSKYFEFVYKDVPISSIDESKLEKGDVILRMGSKENHGLIYVGDNMQAAHASRNAIKYGNNPPILGFEVVQFNRFYKTSTVVSIVRIKNGVVPVDTEVNSTITWPDTGVTEDLFAKFKPEIQEFDEENLKTLYNDENKEVILLDIEEVNISENNETKDNVVYWVSEEIKKLLSKISEEKNEFIEIA